MSDRKRDRSRSPGRSRGYHSSHRNGSERNDYYGGGGHRNGDNGRRSSGAREDPRSARRRAIKQMLAGALRRGKLLDLNALYPRCPTHLLDAQPAEPHSGRVGEPPEERAVELAHALSTRRYLDGGSETEDVAALLVQAAGSFSMHTSLYALTTALCVASAKTIQKSSNRDQGRQDEDPSASGTTGTDDPIDSLDDGPSFGRLVVDGCCNAFAEALREGGFLKAKLLLRFLGELLNCGLIQGQEYGDMLTTLCTGYIRTEHHHVQQPCRDLMAHMILSTVLRVGPTLSKAWVGGFSDLMDEIRAFMATRKAPFRLESLRAIFVTPEDDVDDDEKDENPAVEGGARPIVQDAQPMEDSLIMLWDVVSTLHDSGWHEDELPRAVPRLWKASTVESKLSNLSSLSLLEDFVAADTIPVYFTRMGPCEMIATAGDHGGSSSPADRCDWSYALGIMGERDLFDEDDGAGPASCCPRLLPKRERVVLVEYCKDILACFQPLCRVDGTKVGRWAMLVNQLVSVRDVAPDGCQLVYLVTEVLFLAMLQVPPAEHLAISCHRTILELCRSVPKEAPAAVSYCTGRLFDELERLDSTVASRFGSWFADHLKNTEYKWPFWKHWCNVVELQPDNAQRVFVSNVLAALVKLSYTDRIKKTLPEALWPLMPLDPTPVCPYLDGGEGVSTSLQRIAADMSGRISAREDPEDFEAWLNGDHELHDAQDVNGGDQEAQEAQETTVDPCWRSNMLVQVLLRAGQASPTHTFVYLDRYSQCLQTLRAREDMGEANQIAMLDGVAQLWEHSPQWFCLVCKHLLEMGVLSPISAVHYFFREDNNNAIALSPFLWEVMSRAIALYMDRVSASVAVLQNLENDEKSRSAPEAEGSPTKTPADTSPTTTSTDEKSQRVAEETSHELYTLRQSFDQARNVCTDTVDGFVQALANALPQYAANGITDFSADPWWVSMTSYLKASLWLFAAVPSVPSRHLADGADAGGSQRVFDPVKVETLASAAGCREYVEVIIADIMELV